MSTNIDAPSSGLPRSLVPTLMVSLIAGALGVAATAAGYFLDRPQFFRSYLMAYVFWVGIALGCLPLLLIHHLVGGKWGYAVRRPLEAGALTLPLMGLLFVPILIGLRTLYPWADPSSHAYHAKVVQGKLSYLNANAFTIRAVGYFVYWTFLAVVLNVLSRRQDRPETEPNASYWLGTISGPMLVLQVFAVSFAAIDWIMSLEPEWYSTIFGPLWLSGQVLTTFAFMMLVVVPRRDELPRPDLTAPDPLNDLGNLMLAFVMLWAYAHLSQFLITWAGNMQEEIPWYLERMKGGWQWLGVSLIVFEFILPFLLLLQRPNKRNPSRFVRLAALIVAMDLLATFWLVVPSMGMKTLQIHWLDPAAVVGIGGVWIAAFLALLGRRPLVPGNAPPPDPDDLHVPEGGTR